MLLLLVVVVMVVLAVAVTRGGGTDVLGRRGHGLEVQHPKGKGQQHAQQVLHGAVGGHSAVQGAVTVHRDDPQVTRLRC